MALITKSYYNTCTLFSRSSFDLIDSFTRACERCLVDSFIKKKPRNISLCKVQFYLRKKINQ